MVYSLPPYSRFVSFSLMSCAPHLFILLFTPAPFSWPAGMIRPYFAPKRRVHLRGCLPLQSREHVRCVSSVREICGVPKLLLDHLRVYPLREEHRRACMP